MDAQNAVESANTKQAASSKRGVAESEDPKPTVTANNNTTNNIILPLTAKISSLSKESRPATTTASAQDDDADVDQHSDAETIVLPGKDGVSPSKPRKVIKHEDKSDGEIDVLPPSKKSLKDGKDSKEGREGKDGDRNGISSDAPPATSLEKKKRLFTKEKQPRNKDASSGLSSAPASPPPHRRSNHDQLHRRRRSGDVPSESGSESSKSRSRSKDPIKNKSKSVDRLLPGKRKAPKAESDDESESRKIRRPRISDTSLEHLAGAKEKDSKSSSARLPHDKHSTARNRSLSPHSRTHRRSLSTQLPSQSSNGFSTKKRRIPAPLQSTDYHSDDSSASGSPHPRSSKLRSIATPVTGESTISPARMPAHKKHVDNHGQTLLAKACAKGEYDNAKKRLTERPEDLNFADYAGNTPLQVASLNGHEQIVQLLIDAGCNLDCRNSDKETPLLDAVENGHLGVVKLLLKAGVNPRKADAEGHEPLEKVPDDLENAEEIRAALREAKERVGELRRTSEDHQPHDLPDTLSSHGPESPRRSPTAPGSSSLAAQRRGGAVRSTKTSNHLLYMNLDDKTLRQAAARGDNETVTRVLQVKERCDDPEALVNAARGGHSFVVELLLALGGANADPRPVSSLPPEYGTPMLAAIGGENIEVIKLLLNASNFDPTRRFKGQTYYEIARRREGPLWKDEEHLLKNAYDEFKKAPKGTKTKSPGKRDRDREIDHESRRANRNESNLDTKTQLKRRQSSPSRDADAKKKPSSSKVSGSPKEKRRSLSFGNHDEQTSPKRGPGRPKKEERVSHITTSDREASPHVPKQQPTKSKLVDSDLAGGSSDTEAVKPRRKLISGKDLKGHREKQRRASMASNNSTTDRGDSKNDDGHEKRPDRLSEKYHDRTKAIKRDESNDRLSMGEGSAKRHRSSVTPPRHGLGDNDGEAPIKRRKLDPESKERRQLHTSSPENRQQKRDVSRDPAKRQRPTEADRKESSKAKKPNRDRKESDKSITVASDDVDVEMRDAPQVHAADHNEVQAQAQAERERERERKEAKRRQAEAEAIAAEEAKKEAERQQQEAEAKRQEAEKKRKQEAEAKKQEAEKKRLQEEERIRLEMEEKKRKEEEEKARLEEEQKRKQKEKEEQERKERERKAQEAEAKRKEEELKQQEEARIRREKEAAEEEARRQREEEERERKRAERAAREAEIHRARQEELERIRLSKLPPLLRWLDGCPDPKQKEIAELFSKALGVRYDTINPSATGKPEGREQWMLNTQVALLLGEKDTQLSRYTAWERLPVSQIAKRIIWRLEQDRYSLTQSKLYHLGEQMPDYYGGDPRTVGYRRLEQLRGEAAKLFFDMDNMFFVKESDFLYIVPTIPHLRNVKLSICYCELPESESALTTFSSPAKWKRDLDAESRGGFAPRSKHYINGQLVGEDKPGRYQPSKTPFPENRVPRRGLIAVTSDDPDYARLCFEQGLAHLLNDEQKLAMQNAAHLTPRSMVSNEPLDYTSENLSPSTKSPRAAQANGIKSAQESPDRFPANGINGDGLGDH